MYGALKSSTRICTPPASITRSSARRLSSKAMPYCMPEQPPPLTKMRSASWGLPSFSSRSLRRVWASGVSETTACSITQRVYQPYGPELLPLPELEAPALGLLVLAGGLAGDQLRQLLGPMADRALGVGQDQDLALDGRLVRLGAVELDLDRELLLEGPDDVLLAHHRLRHLVVEGEDDPPRDDVEDVREDAEQLAHVLQRRKLGRHENEHALGVVEDGDHDVGESDAEVEDDVAEGVDQDAHRPVDQVDVDEVRLLGAEHAREQHHAARVVEDRPEHRLLEVGRRDLRGRGQAARRGEVGDQRRVVVRERQVDQQHLAREALAQRGGEVDR